MTMGIQALVVLGGIVAALVVGAVVGLGSNSPSAMGWTVLVFGAATYAALSLVERALGRGIWEYTAPYPYDSAGTGSTDATVTPDRPRVVRRANNTAGRAVWGEPEAADAGGSR